MGKNFEQLTSSELWKLRNEIVLCSIKDADYINSFDFNPKNIACFFDGYYDYLCELAEEDGDTSVSPLEYDSEENLYAWFHCYDDLSWITFTE